MMCIIDILRVYHVHCLVLFSTICTFDGLLYIFFKGMVTEVPILTDKNIPNRNWGLFIVPASTTRCANDLGYKMANI